jgi:hypothetical protein
VCEVNEFSYLTDYELEAKAAEAKKFAKDTGKNKISLIDASNPLSKAFEYKGHNVEACSLN